MFMIKIAFIIFFISYTRYAYFVFILQAHNMFRRNVEPTASNMVELVSNVMNLFLFYKEVSEFSSSYNLLHYSNQIKHKSTLRFFRFQVCNRIQTIKLLLKRDDEFNDIFSDVFLIYF